jgi:DNA-binding MarR family transcriptional regulator
MSTASLQSRNPILQYLRLYIKEDDDLLEHVLLVCFSSFTSDPLNLGIMAPTSTGKSYVVSLVVGLFPNAESLTGATAKAFFYENGTLVEDEVTEERDPVIGSVRMVHAELQGRVDALRERIDADKEDYASKAELKDLLARSMIRVNLERRILVFLEPPTAELFEALKPLLSHDKWESVYKTVDRGSSGQQVTKKILLVGWPTFIFCSAKNLDTWQMWPEIQSRCVIVSPKMDPDKYREANELTAKLLGLPSFALRELFPKDFELLARDEVRSVEQALDRLRLLGGSEGDGSKRDNFVLNPFAGQLAAIFPHEDGVTMRQFRYLLKYVNLLAMTNGGTRPKLVIRDQARAIVATYEDVRRAIELVYSSTWTSLPRYKVDFYEDVLLPVYEATAREVQNRKQGTLVKEKVYDAVPTKAVLEFARSKGMKVGGSSIRKSYLEALEEVGLATSEVDSADKRAYLWRPVQIPRIYEKLRESRSYSRDGVIGALKQSQTDMGNLVVNYAYPDGRLVSDLQELAGVIFPEQPDNSDTSDKPEAGGNAAKEQTAKMHSGEEAETKTGDELSPGPLHDGVISQPRPDSPPPPSPGQVLCPECGKEPLDPDHVSYVDKNGRRICRGCQIALQRKEWQERKP